MNVMMAQRNRNIFYDPSKSTLRRLLLGTIARDQNGLYYLVDEDRNITRYNVNSIRTTSEQDTNDVISSTTDIRSPINQTRPSERCDITGTTNNSNSNNNLIVTRSDSRRFSQLDNAILSSRPAVTNDGSNNRLKDNRFRINPRLGRYVKSGRITYSITKAMDTLEIPRASRSDMYFFRSLLNDLKCVPTAKKFRLKAKIQKVIKDEIAKNNRSKSIV